jgi:hypothetical protein
MYLINVFNVDVSLKYLQHEDKPEPILIVSENEIYKEMGIISKWITSCVNTRQIEVCDNIVDKFIRKYQHNSYLHLKQLISEKRQQVTAY